MRIDPICAWPPSIVRFNAAWPSQQVLILLVMAKSRKVFVCRACGAEFPSWTGQCHSCDEWASVGEAAVTASTPSVGTNAARPLAEVGQEFSLPFPVGVSEVDRVLGGGFAPGSCSLLAGEPGIGKSTLTLQIGLSMAQVGATVVLIAGEEAPSQVAARAARLGPVPESLLVVEDTDLNAIRAVIEQEKPQLVVVDSIQMVRDSSLDNEPGSVRQVKSVVRQLLDIAKPVGVSLLLVGHVTKDGAIAGPRVLEHLVDTVLSFDGERHGGLRSLRAIKHRFGPTDEVGVFEMTAEGLQAVPDPSDRYLQDRQAGLAGSVVFPSLNGRRPVLVEIQGLVGPLAGPVGQLSVQGLSHKRVSLVSAVLASRAGRAFNRNDVFCSAAGGASIDEPAADLAIALALVSALEGRPLSPDVAVCGELGLGGEVRNVPQLEHRLQELYRMGFRTAIAPSAAAQGPTGLTVIAVDTVSEAIALGLASGQPAAAAAA